MPDLFDTTDAFDRLLLDVVQKGGTTQEQTFRYLRYLRDAEQAQQPFARPELEACQITGAQQRLKRHVKARCLVAASTRNGRSTIDIATVRGVRRQGKWCQVPIEQLTIDEFAGVVASATKSRNRATERLGPMRRILDAVKDSTEPTVGKALVAAGTTLGDVLARAS